MAIQLKVDLLMQNLRSRYFGDVFLKQKNLWERLSSTTLFSCLIIKLVTRKNTFPVNVLFLYVIHKISLQIRMIIACYEGFEREEINDFWMMGKKKQV